MYIQLALHKDLQRPLGTGLLYEIEGMLFKRVSQKLESMMYLVSRASYTLFFEHCAQVYAAQ